MSFPDGRKVGGHSDEGNDIPRVSGDRVPTARRADTSDQVTDLIGR